MLRELEVAEYKKEIGTAVTISVVFALLVGAVAIYAFPALTGNSTGGSTTSTTSTASCDQAHPLTLVSATWSGNPSSLTLYSRWSNCASRSVNFLVTGQNLLVVVTINGQAKNYSGYIGNNGGIVGIAGASGFGNLSQSLSFSSQTSQNATVFIVSGTLIAIDPVTNQEISAPSVFSAVG